MALYIGTSGWQYRHWRGTFYPEGLRQAEELEYYSERSQVVEVNNAFYRLPPSSTFEKWAQRTPDDFVVGVKASRYLTHVRRLIEPSEPVGRFVDRIRHLGPKLGPVLLQLPPTLRAEPVRLDETLSLFPHGVRVAVEFRHESWFNDETRDVLGGHGAAFCLAYSPRRRTPVWRTADWAYLRLHEGRASPPPCYGRAALLTWARRLAEMWGPEADAYVFFNNDVRTCAVRDAAVFAGVARSCGLHPTRVPAVRSVRVGG